MELYGKILLIAMPAFLLLVLFEKWWGWRKHRDTVRNLDMISSLSSGVTNVTNVTTVTALASLPCEARITVTNGISYYQCGKDWYTRAYQGDQVVYVPSGPPPSR